MYHFAGIYYLQHEYTDIVLYCIVKLAVLFLFLNWPWCPRARMKGGLGALPTGLGALKN